MIYVEVDSSMIKGFSYEPEDKFLVVTFNNESSYAYFDVPEELVKDMIVSASVGKFFNQNILNVFEFEKTEPE